MLWISCSRLKQRVQHTVVQQTKEEVCRTIESPLDDNILHVRLILQAGYEGYWVVLP